jgi:aspartate aminotransferase
MSPPIPLPAARVDQLPRSGTRAIAALLGGRTDVINLLFGEPDFDTAPHIAHAGIEAIEQGLTRYAPGAGIPELREVAAASVARRASVPVDPDAVVVTAGGVQGVFGALATLASRGDRVLVPDPGWPNYLGQCELLGLQVVRYTLAAANVFEPDLDELDRLCADTRAKVLLINNPGNPTGAVWSPEAVEGCVDIARRHGMWLVSDEVYDEITFEREHTSALGVDDGDGTVVAVYSCSKTYAMTGWRVGYTIAAERTAALITKVLEHEASSVMTPAQHAAVAAIDGPRAPVREMSEAYRRRRDLAVRALQEERLFTTTPQGAFYVMADVSSATTDATAFARALAAQVNGVACAPGDSFGSNGAGLLRISLAAAPEAIEEGIVRIARAVRAWSRADEERAG